MIVLILLIAVTIVLLILVYALMAYWRIKLKLKPYEISEDEIDSTVGSVKSADKSERKVCPMCFQYVSLVRNRFEAHVRENGKSCAASFLTPSAARLVSRSNRGHHATNGPEENRSGSAGEADRGTVPKGGTDPSDEGG